MASVNPWAEAAAGGSLRQLRIICVLMGIAFAGASMMEPLVPLYSLSLGYSPAAVGFIVSAAHLLPIFTAVPFGSLTDRWGPRRILAIGAVGSLLGPVLLALVPGFGALVTAQVLLGTSHLLMTLAGQTYVGFLGRGDRLESYFGWFTTAISAGQLVGPPLAGMLADSAGFRWAFGATGALFVVPILLSRGLVPGPVVAPASSAGKEGRQGPSGPGRLALLRIPEFQVALWGSCSVLVAMGVRRAFLPLYLDQLAYSASFIGVIMSVRALASMAVRAVMPALIRTLGGRGKALVIMTLVTALSVGTLGLLRSAPLLFSAALLTGLGMGITQPLTMVIAADAVPRSQHGLAMGIRLTGNRLAQLVSPLIFGFVVESGGYGVAFLVAGGLLASSAFIINRLRPRLEVPAGAPAGQERGM